MRCLLPLLLTLTAIATLEAQNTSGTSPRGKNPPIRLNAGSDDEDATSPSAPGGNVGISGNQGAEGKDEPQDRMGRLEKRVDDLSSQLAKALDLLGALEQRLPAPTAAPDDKQQEPSPPPAAKPVSYAAGAVLEYFAITQENFQVQQTTGALGSALDSSGEFKSNNFMSTPAAQDYARAHTIGTLWRGYLMITEESDYSFSVEADTVHPYNRPDIYGALGIGSVTIASASDSQRPTLQHVHLAPGYYEIKLWLGIDSRNLSGVQTQGLVRVKYKTAAATEFTSLTPAKLLHQTTP